MPEIVAIIEVHEEAVAVQSARQRRRFLKRNGNVGKCLKTELDSHYTGTAESLCRFFVARSLLGQIQQKLDRL